MARKLFKKKKKLEIELTFKMTYINKQIDEQNIIKQLRWCGTQEVKAMVFSFRSGNLANRRTF